MVRRSIVSGSKECAPAPCRRAAACTRPTGRRRAPRARARGSAAARRARRARGAGRRGGARGRRAARSSAPTPVHVAEGNGAGARRREVSDRPGATGRSSRRTACSVAAKTVATVARCMIGAVERRAQLMSTPADLYSLGSVWRSSTSARLPRGTSCEQHAPAARHRTDHWPRPARDGYRSRSAQLLSSCREGGVAAAPGLARDRPRRRAGGWAQDGPRARARHNSARSSSSRDRDSPSRSRAPRRPLGARRALGRRPAGARGQGRGGGRRRARRRRLVDKLPMRRPPHVLAVEGDFLDEGRARGRRAATRRHARATPRARRRRRGGGAGGAERAEEDGGAGSTAARRRTAARGRTARAAADGDGFGAADGDGLARRTQYWRPARRSPARSTGALGRARPERCLAAGRAGGARAARAAPGRGRRRVLPCLRGPDEREPLTGRAALPRRARRQAGRRARAVTEPTSSPATSARRIARAIACVVPAGTAPAPRGAAAKVASGLRFALPRGAPPPPRARGHRAAARRARRRAGAGAGAARLGDDATRGGQRCPSRRDARHHRVAQPSRPYARRRAAEEE